MPPTIIVLFVVAAVSVLIAILLSKISSLSSQAKVLEEARRKASLALAQGAIHGDHLKEAISEEIKEAVDSPDTRRELSEKIANIFNKELGQKINQHAQELTKKYEMILKEGKQNEEMAWKKYNKVLTDKKNTEAVIRSIAEGLVVVDANGKVVMMNPAAERLLGISKKSKIGRPVSENLREEQLISLVSGSEEQGNREIEMISKHDETKKVLRASSAVIENENGQTVGMVSVLSDITKQKQLDRLKNEFVASVSHELRTPLVAISKSLSLLLGKAAGHLSEVQEQFLSIAERNLERLSRVIDDLLDLSKLESGKMEVKFAPVALGEVITEVIDGLHSWAESKSITIRKEIPEGIPEINIDQGRMIQVLNNLIGNAIKFTPKEGTITVSAELLAEEGALKVSVEDTGIGIDEKDLPKLFDKFYQAGERLSADVNGTGIGLSIARELIQLHGGKIWAESEVGQGAKFSFTLPLQKS